VRIALISDGMYPFRQGVGGTWCHRLVRGLPEHAFHLVSVTDIAPAAPAYHPPVNTLTLTSIAITGPSNAPKRGRPAMAHRRPATHAAVLLCRSMLEDTPHSVAMFRSALRRLAMAASNGTHPLGGVPLGAVLLDAWHAAYKPQGGAPGTTPPRPALPEPTPRDAADAATLLEQAVRPLATLLPLTDLNHAVDAGLSALMALAAKWRTGTPYVLTEHQPYLNAPLLERTTGRPAVRTVLLRFFRALARLSYTEASSIAMPTEPLARWALNHNADGEKVSIVPYGIDPHNNPVLRGEPTEPKITWLGPSRDLPSMLSAMTTIRMTVPDARLVVAGTASSLEPAHGPYVNFLGPITHRRSAFSTGQIVVLGGGDATMPYALIESMMCGRPTICTDDGDLAPTAGPGAIIVPHDHPARLAEACLALLTAPERRQHLAVTASERARTVFGLRKVLDRFRDIYEIARHDTSAPTERFIPVVPSVPGAPVIPSAPGVPAPM
jgi:glycosyltransferase involved in cell wall biosynthesis